MYIAIGKIASDFIQEELKMDYAYEYMFLLPNEYAKLLKFKPQVPDGAAGMCSEILAFSAEHGLERKFMIESFVKSPPTTCPGTMPPPFKPGADFVHHYKKPEV
jgi:hypothetical protein